VHAASELTAAVAAAVAAERPSGLDRVQWTDRMGTRTGSLARFVQVLLVLSIPPTGTQPDSQTSPEEFCEAIHRVCGPKLCRPCDSRKRNASVANGSHLVTSFCRIPNV
jgi:hypothetical protein